MYHESYRYYLLSLTLYEKLLKTNYKACDIRKRTIPRTMRYIKMNEKDNDTFFFFFTNDSSIWSNTKVWVTGWKISIHPVFYFHRLDNRWVSFIATQFIVQAYRSGGHSDTCDRV